MNGSRISKSKKLILSNHVYLSKYTTMVEIGSFILLHFNVRIKIFLWFTNFYDQKIFLSDETKNLSGHQKIYLVSKETKLFQFQWCHQSSVKGCEAP